MPTKLMTLSFSSPSDVVLLRCPQHTEFAANLLKERDNVYGQKAKVRYLDPCPPSPFFPIAFKHSLLSYSCQTHLSYRYRRQARLTWLAFLRNSYHSVCRPNKSTTLVAPTSSLAEQR